MENKKALIIKILVPVLIIAIVGVMWFVKNPPSDSDLIIVTDPPAEQIEGADFSLNATELIDYEVLSEYGLPIIVDYGADSCIPCKAMAPVLKTLNAEMQGKAFIKFVDVWQYYEAAANVPIQLIPSQVIFNPDGTPYEPSGDAVDQIGGFKLYSDQESGEHIFTVHEGGLTEEQMRLILAEMGVE